MSYPWQTLLSLFWPRGRLETGPKSSVPYVKIFAKAPLSCQAFVLGQKVGDFTTGLHSNLWRLQGTLSKFHQRKSIFVAENDLS